MNHLLKILFFGVILYGCVENSHNNDIKSIIPEKQGISKQEELELYNKVIQTGDTNAYNELASRYIDSRMTNSLFLSFVMANKYNYVPANFEIYRAFAFSFNKQETRITVEKMGKSNYELALNYLKKGANLGDWQCIETINELYPELKEK